MQLEPCATCRRHIRTTASRCPFCGGAASSVIARMFEQGGRLSRAAIFAGAAACTSKPPPQPQLDQRPPPPPADAMIARDTAVPVDAALPADAAVAAVVIDAAVSGIGSIEGVVTKGGSVAGGVEVTLAGHEQRHTKTDARGHYKFIGLSVGLYTVSVPQEIDNPHMPPPPPRRVQVTPNTTASANLVIYEPMPDNGPCCKPYGAPPARRRVV